MPLIFCSLNSGSNGNCYYVGNGSEAVLIDAGISCREITRRMAASSLDMNKVKAIFISHEHTDHIKGVETLSGKYNIPVYITSRTASNSNLNISSALRRNLGTEKISLGNLVIEAFSKKHDAADPHNFIVSSEGYSVGVFTDIGAVCNTLKQKFAECQAVFLESNYDRKMLENGPYPYHLKKRISGGLGHLSNDEALDLFKKHRNPALQYLLLSHLSKENNCPTLVAELFSSHAGKTKVSVASRYMPSPVYSLSEISIRVPAKQLALF